MKRTKFLSADELTAIVNSDKGIITKAYVDGLIPSMRPSTIRALITENDLVSRNGNEGHISSLTVAKENGSVVVAIGIAPPNHPRPHSYTSKEHAQYQKRARLGWTRDQMIQFSKEKEQWLEEFKQAISESEDGWRIVKIEQPKTVKRTLICPTRSANTVIWVTRIARKPWATIRPIADKSASRLVMGGEGY
jgi:hypothetical protein